MERFNPSPGDADLRAAEDLAAVEEVLAGRSERFRDLVLRYQNLVAGIAWRSGCRREDVEDVPASSFTVRAGEVHPGVMATTS